MHQQKTERLESNVMGNSIPANVLQMLQSCRTLPNVPGVVMDVFDLSQNPDLGTAKVAKVVARDPALVAKVLKVANSSWCGVWREVTTLSQAVHLLGINDTLSLALSFSLVHGLQKSESNTTFDHQVYWRRSVIAATAAFSIGKFLKTKNSDEMFVAGLLQDIGMLVLNEAVRTYGNIVAASKNNHRLLVETEREELGTDHAHVGRWFLEKWGLPDRLISAVSRSHDLEGVTEPLAKSVGVSGNIAEIWTDPETSAATARTAEASRKLMDLSRDQLDVILAKTAANLPEIAANLEIPVGNEMLINGLLDHAREAIADLNIRTLQQAQHFAVQVQRDALTSLYNRTYLNQALEAEFDLARSMAQPLTVIFADIDNFNKINDSYGHHAGDIVLNSVAHVIQSVTRDSDTVARFGGDEFVVLLTNTGEEMAFKIAERIRSLVEGHPHNTGNGHRLYVTVSVGWATLSAKSSLLSAKELLNSADRSLYAAKGAGRNCVAQAV